MIRRKLSASVGLKASESRNEDTASWEDVVSTGFRFCGWTTPSKDARLGRKLRVLPLDAMAFAGKSRHRDISNRQDQALSDLSSRGQVRSVGPFALFGGYGVV